jgi:hypothetical protein
MPKKAPSKKPKGGSRKGETARELQLEVLPPDAGGSTCEGKSSTLFSAITTRCLEMFGDVENLDTYSQVEILMVRHGWSGADVARALGITQQAVSLHWTKICSELDLNGTPESRRLILARQCDTIYQRASRMDDEAKGLLIAARTIEIRAKLWGVNMDEQAAGAALVPYSTPEEIADRVRQQVLAIHGRSNLIEQQPFPATGISGTSQSASHLPTG